MKVQIVGEGRAVALLLPSRGDGLHPALASVVLPSGCALVVVSFVTIRVASPTDDDLERVEDLVFNHECAGVIAYSGASRIALGGLQAALPTVCLGGDALPLTLPGGGRPHLIYGDEDPVMAKNQRAIGTGAYDVSRCRGGHSLADYVRAEALSRALTILGV